MQRIAFSALLAFFMLFMFFTVATGVAERPSPLVWSPAASLATVAIESRLTLSLRLSGPACGPTVVWSQLLGFPFWGHSVSDLLYQPADGLTRRPPKKHEH